MNIKNLTPEERYELVLECRSSGLTDHQWLEEHGIPKSTFTTGSPNSGKKDIPIFPGLFVRAHLTGRRSRRL